MRQDGLKDFPRVEAVVMSIDVSPPISDVARSAENSYLYQLRGAHNVGIYEPFDPEQTALNAYLAARQAGKKLCDYAWRLYAQSL